MQNFSPVMLGSLFILLAPICFSCKEGAGSYVPQKYRLSRQVPHGQAAVLEFRGPFPNKPTPRSPRFQLPLTVMAPQLLTGGPTVTIVGVFSADHCVADVKRLALGHLCELISADPSSAVVDHSNVEFRRGDELVGNDVMVKDVVGEGGCVVYVHYLLLSAIRPKPHSLDFGHFAADDVVLTLNVFLNNTDLAVRNADFQFQSTASVDLVLHAVRHFCAMKSAWDDQWKVFEHYFEFAPCRMHSGGALVENDVLIRDLVHVDLFVDIDIA